MGKVILTGHVIVPEDEADAISRAIPEHIRLTRAEPGCLIFTLEQDKTNPFKIALYEEYIDQAAFDFHQERTKKSLWFNIAKNLDRHFSILEE